MYETIIEIIQGMLAPGIMISACGLLLLGMNNKYSMVVSRIRVLNMEYRQIDKNDKERIDCILSQLPLLIKRMRYLRNAVWLYTIAIGMFIFSMFSLGWYLLEGKTFLQSTMSGILFIIALIAVLYGVIYAAREVRLCYKILKIETKNIPFD